MARARSKPQFREIKWVGDAAVVKSDGFGVANWKYENNRVMSGFNSVRVLQPGDCGDLIPAAVDAKGQVLRWKTQPGTGIEHEYIWDNRQNKSRIVAVSYADAEKILRNAGGEFRDVTDERRPEAVRTDVIVAKPKPKGTTRGSR
jgi:hypothetical protein